MIKDASNGSPDWWIFDNMRGVATGGVDMGLRPNTSGAEVTGNNYLSFTATGFQPTATTNTVNQSGDTYIYIAIRRGPMKVPTTGTSVFTPLARSGTGSNTTITAGFPVDLALTGNRGAVTRFGAVARLTNNQYLVTMTTQLGQISANAYQANTFDNQTGVNLGTTSTLTNDSSSSFINYMMARAPSFLDVVCYTGTGASTRTLNHNLGVAPELVIIKTISDSANWTVWNSKTANGVLLFNGTDALDTSASEVGNPTATTFDVKVNGSSTYDSNWNGYNYVAYLFASCPGVSRVGSFTGTGATQVINCGFTGGARFVLIKATSTSGGNWMVWDTARGIVPSNDPYVTFNSSSAEVTNTDWVDTAATGFELSNAGGNLANSNGVSYIFLAIA
jgi:hypothetical protein